MLERVPITFTVGVKPGDVSDSKCYANLVKEMEYNIQE